MRDKGIGNKITVLVCAVLMTVTSAMSVYAAEDGLQSSFEYKYYRSNGVYREVLKYSMPDVYKKLAAGMDDEKTIPIPGVVRTYTSVSSDDNTSTYIPQGLCRAGRYWLMTAYDGDKKGPSVIYAVDTEKQRVVSTMLLPNKYHVGGIDFDGKRIWLTGDTSDRYKGSPFVQYIKNDDFLEMVKENVVEVGKDRLSDPVYIKNKPSFLDCDGGKLWVGTYIGTKGSKEGYIYGYPIIDKEDGEGGLNTLLFSVITAIDSSAQGMDIDGRYLYVSSSYRSNAVRLNSSFVTKYDIHPVKGSVPNLYVGDREVRRIEVPKMNEEILVEDGEVHINFESSADKYLAPVVATDRVLSVRKARWGKQTREKPAK